MATIADDRNTPELDARTGLDKLATFPFQIASWVDDGGYPVSVAVEATIDPAGLTATFAAPAGLSCGARVDLVVDGPYAFLAVGNNLTAHRLVGSSLPTVGNQIATLDPGRYIAVCFLPAGGAEGSPPHFMQGMTAEFEVA